MGEGKEEKRLRKIVFRTASSIKILPNETLPKNIRGEDLPLLEGAEPVAEMEVKVDNDDKELKAFKKSGKIKRRGKKKTKSDKEQEIASDDQIEKSDYSTENNSAIKESLDRNEITNIIEASKKNNRKIENCKQLANFTNGKESLLINKHLDSVNAVKKVTKRLVQTHVPNVKYDEAVQISKQHL